MLRISSPSSRHRAERIRDNATSRPRSSTYAAARRDAVAPLARQRDNGGMFGFRQAQPPCPPPKQALPGRSERDLSPDRRAHEVLRHPRGHRRGPRGLRGRRLRPGLLLGRRGDLLAAAGRLVDVGRLRRRHHAQPVVRGGLPGGPAHRGRPGGLRPRRSRTPTWSSRSSRCTTRPRACARATTSAPSTARRSTTRPEQEQAAARADRGLRPELAPRGSARSPPRSSRPEPLLLRRGPAPAVPAKNPFGYRCHANTGVKFPATA